MPHDIPQPVHSTGQDLSSDTTSQTCTQGQNPTLQHCYCPTQQSISHPPQSQHEVEALKATEVDSMPNSLYYQRKLVPTQHLILGPPEEVT